MRALAFIFVFVVLLAPHALSEETAQELITEAELDRLQEFSDRHSGTLDINGIAHRVICGETIQSEKVVPLVQKAAGGMLKETTRALSGMILPALMLVFIGCLCTEGSGGVSGARFLLIISLIGMMSKIVLSALELASGCLKAALEFSDAVSPVLISLTTAAGMNSSAALVTPLSALAANIVEILLSKYGSFACRCTLVFSIAGSLSDAIDLSAAVTFIRKTVNWSCGLIGTLFAAMISLQSSVASAADNAAVRAAKYTVDSLSSLIGSGVSDAWGTYVSGVMIAKNAVGFSGVIALIAVGLRPVVGIAASMLALNIVQMLLNAVGERRAARAAEQLSGVCQMSLAICCGAITVASVLCGSFMLAGKGLLF